MWVWMDGVGDVNQRTRARAHLLVRRLPALLDGLDALAAAELRLLHDEDEAGDLGVHPRDQRRQALVLQRVLPARRLDQALALVPARGGMGVDMFVWLDRKAVR